jgi:cysteine desulfurase/selenocysteine lyase
MDNIREHEKGITKYALERLSAVPDVKIYGPKTPEERVGVLSFNLGDIHAHDVSQVLDQHGVAVRASHHCTQPLMRRLDCAATARASFYIYNTYAEVDVLVEAVEAAAKYFATETPIKVT